MPANKTAATPSLRSRLRDGVAWSLACTVFTQGSTFAVGIVIANLLGRKSFGEYAMIQSTLLTLANCASLGTGATVTKYVAQFRSTSAARTANVLELCARVAAVTACGGALMLLVGAPWLAAESLKAPHLAGALAIAAPVAVFLVLNGYQAGALAGFESYRSLAATGGVAGVLQLALCSAGAWWAGLNGALAGLAASAAARWLTASMFLKRACACHGVDCAHASPWQERPMLYRFALPSALSGLSSVPAIWLANMLLVRQPDGYDQMALFSVANSMRILMLLLPGIVNTVSTSLINHELGLADGANYRRLFWANLAFAAGAVICAGGGVALAGPAILRMFGKSFSAGYPVLLVMMLATIPEALSIAVYQVVQSKARMWVSFLAICLPRDWLLVAAAYVLAGRQGALGLGWSYVASQLVGLLAVLAIVGRLGLGVHAPGAPAAPRAADSLLLEGSAS
jgi:O-antigen/teichoic acid export membrane protein